MKSKCIPLKYTLYINIIRMISKMSIHPLIFCRERLHNLSPTHIHLWLVWCQMPLMTMSARMPMAKQWLFSYDTTTTTSIFAYCIRGIGDYASCLQFAINASAVCWTHSEWFCLMISLELRIRQGLFVWLLIKRIL